MKEDDEFLGLDEINLDTIEFTPDPNFNLARFRLPYDVHANPARWLAMYEQRAPMDPHPKQNCQLFVWRVYDEIFHRRLPANMLSKEIWEMESGLFVPVHKMDEMHKLGDIYFFQPHPIVERADYDPKDPKNYHLGIFIGLSQSMPDYKRNIPLIAHTSKETKTVVIEPLTDLIISQNGTPPRYEKFLGVRRLEPETWNHVLGPHVGKYLYIKE